MNYNKLNLSLLAILTISLFFVIPIYNRWLLGNLFSPEASVVNQYNHLDVKERQLERYGPSYQVYRRVADAFDKSHARDAVVLLPPNTYLKSLHIKEFTSVEPAVFYYLTGYKAVWTNSPGVDQANWAIVAQNNQIQLHRIANKQELDNLLALYKPYKPVL